MTFMDYWFGCPDCSCPTEDHDFGGRCLKCGEYCKQPVKKDGKKPWRLHRPDKSGH